MLIQFYDFSRVFKICSLNTCLVCEIKLEKYCFLVGLAYFNVWLKTTDVYSWGLEIFHQCGSTVGGATLESDLHKRDGLCQFTTEILCCRCSFTTNTYLCQIMDVCFRLICDSSEGWWKDKESRKKSGAKRSVWLVDTADCHNNMLKVSWNFLHPKPSELPTQTAF